MVIIEKEIKHILDKQSFRKLYSYLAGRKKPDFVVRQVNYYFDTEAFTMQHQGTSIRIRILPDKAELTCKIAAVDERKAGDFMQSYEYTKGITLLNAHNYIKNGIPINVIRDFLMHHGVEANPGLSPLVCQGHLRTARIAFTIEKGLDPLLMDINFYLGTFDYELEWETTDLNRARQLLKDLFDQSKISFPISNKLKTKRKRYFERKSMLESLSNKRL